VIKNLRCFKCHGDSATLTYEENRIYKVSCQCGCEYTFEHSSQSAAHEYHNKMVELYAEIDGNATLKAENADLRAQLTAYKETDLTSEEIFQMRREWRDTEKGLRDNVIQLQARLTASQQRERAAVVERDVAINQLHGNCWACKHAKPWEMGLRTLQTCDHMRALASTGRPKCEHWEWRGPQEAEEGADDGIQRN